MNNRSGHSKSDRKSRLGLFIMVCLVLMAASAVITYNIVTGGADRSFIESAKNYAEIEQTVKDYYIGDVDTDAMHSAASAAMVRALGDKWSYYMTPEEYAAYKLSNENEYAGVGMSIGINKDGDYFINSVDAGSVAAAAGIMSGQRLLSVDGQKVKNMNLDEVQNLIRSKLNVDFVVVVSDEKGNETAMNLNCAASYKSPVIYKMMNEDVGYVIIKNFEAGCADDAITGIQFLMTSGATSFVFDLRNNPGGLFDEMAKLLDFLLPDGVLYTSVDMAGHKTNVKSDKICLKYEMAVIVNEESYGAAEFFAAAIQDYNWGSVVGAQTSGKSRNQITVELSNGDALHISCGNYLTSKGVDLAQTGGVAPNIAVAMDDESEGDEQLNAAINLLKPKSGDD